MLYRVDKRVLRGQAIFSRRAYQKTGSRKVK